MKDIKQMLLGMVLMLAGIYIICNVAPMDGPSFDAAKFFIVSHILFIVGAIIAIHGYFKRNP